MEFFELSFVIFLLHHLIYCVSSQPRCGSNEVDRYVIVNKEETWSNARLYCQDMDHTDLVVIDSDEERTYLDKLLPAGSYWIGLNDGESEGFFRWTNTAEDQEIHPGWLWHQDEPSTNFELISENCGLFTKDGWYNVHGLIDADCGLLNDVVCEDDSHPCTPDQYYTDESCDIAGRYTVHYYVYHDWFQARDFCLSEGKVIASLNSEAEVRFVRVGLQKLSSPQNGFSYWVGLNDIDQEGTWTWEGHPEFGEELDSPNFGRWNPYEPNGGMGENCVELKTPPEGGPRGFNDVDCGWTKPFVCELLTTCPSGREDYFTVYSDHRLVNHVLYSLEVRRLSRCTRLCLQDNACRSVNLIPTEDETRFSCEVNGEAKEQSLRTDYISFSGGVYASFS